MIVEVVSQEDAQSDMTAAVDIHAGLGAGFEAHLVHLGRLAGKLSRPTDVFSLALDSPEFEDRLTDIFRLLQADIVHTHRFADLAKIGRAAHRADVGHLIHTINDVSEVSAKLNAPGLSTLLKRHKPLLVTIDRTLPDHLDLGGQVVAHAPQGIDSERYRPGNADRARRMVGLPQNAQIIGCASPFAHLNPFLQSIVDLGPRVHVALFGDATPDTAQRRWIKQLDLDERVHVLGPWVEPRHFYQAMDVYFHGPAAAPHPRPVLAAQAAGISVVVTAPTCPTAISPTGGTLIETQSTTALSAAIRRAISGIPGPAGRQFIETNWSARLTIDAYRDIFTSLSAAASESV